MENSCNFVSSRGILKSCTFHSSNPRSSWCYDTEYLHIMLRENKMFDGMSIYVCTDVIPYFIDSILPHITNTFFLVCGDSDATVPDGIIDMWHNPRKLETIKCLELLTHPKLIKWFAQNCILHHEKIDQLPIGLDYHTIANDPNKPWRDAHEGCSPKEQEEILLNIRNTMKPIHDRIFKIFVNFTVDLSNEHDQRTIILKQIPQHLTVQTDIGFKPRTHVWKRMAEYSFVLSPYGNGPDCHRTWEILCLGCIPIIKSFGTCKMFEGLPVLLVKEWSDVTETLLQDTLETFKHTNFNYDKLLLRYWVNSFSLKGVT